jgi:hypothetical protein
VAVAGGGASEQQRLTLAGKPAPAPNPRSCRLLANHGLSETELGIVANLSIETPDEARKLVPTLDVSRGGGFLPFLLLLLLLQLACPWGAAMRRLHPGWPACARQWATRRPLNRPPAAAAAHCDASPVVPVGTLLVPVVVCRTPPASPMMCWRTC